ncbi:unnamed protein product, partial [Closterium sp. NIES-53]
CLLLPYLFPELSAFATEEDLVSHLHTSDARYRAALPAEFLAKNPPPVYITHNFIVTRLPDSLRAVTDHFLALDPTALTVDLLEQHLLAVETSVVAIGAAHGTPRTPFFEGCSPSPLALSYTSAAAIDVLGAEDVRAASASAKRRNNKGKGGRSGGGGSGGGGGGSSGGGGGSGGGGSSGSGGRSGGFGEVGGGSDEGGGSGGSGRGGSMAGATQRGGLGSGQRQQQQRRSETPSPQQLRKWFSLRGASGGSASCPYVIRTGASESVLPGTAPAEASHTFTLDLGASRCGGGGGSAGSDGGGGGGGDASAAPNGAYNDALFNRSSTGTPPCWSSVDHLPPSQMLIPSPHSSLLTSTSSTPPPLPNCSSFNSSSTSSSYSSRSSSHSRPSGALALRLRCKAYVHIPPPDRSHAASKLASCALECVYLGHNRDSPEYLFLHPPLHLLICSIDVVFDEPPYCSATPPDPLPPLSRPFARTDSVLPPLLPPAPVLPPVTASLPTSSFTDIYDPAAPSSPEHTAAPPPPSPSSSHSPSKQHTQQQQPQPHHQSQQQQQQP